MIQPWVHEIAHQRRQDLLAGAKRYQLRRIVPRRERPDATDRQPAGSRRPLVEVLVTPDRPTATPRLACGSMPSGSTSCSGRRAAAGTPPG
jgi:hypothetical protein